MLASAPGYGAPTTSPDSVSPHRFLRPIPNPVSKEETWGSRQTTLLLDPLSPLRHGVGNLLEGVKS